MGLIHNSSQLQQSIQEAINSSDHLWHMCESLPEARIGLVNYAAKIYGVNHNGWAQTMYIKLQKVIE